MPVIAITGGVGTGKSTAAEYFRELGAVVFSADEAAREVLSPGSQALSEVIAEFGPSYLRHDGSLDRHLLGDLVFSDPIARKRLEEITHPAIRDLLHARVEETRRRQPDTPIFVEIPLLYETGTESAYDAVITVASCRDVQVRRLAARDRLNPQEIDKRIAAQLPMEEKAACADYLIDNDGNRDALKRAVRSVWDQIVLSGTESNTKSR